MRRATEDPSDGSEHVADQKPLTHGQAVKVSFLILGSGVGVGFIGWAISHALGFSK